MVSAASQPGQQRPAWSPPKPTFQDALKLVMELVSENGNFTTPAFRDSIKQSFIATGCNCDDQFNFKEFQLLDTPRGTLKTEPCNCLPIVDILMGEGDGDDDENQFDDENQNDTDD